MSSPSVADLPENKEGVHKLKMLVQSLKKKYGDAIAQAYTLEAKCRELTAENSTLKQTQTALSQKFNETLVELSALQQEQEKLIKEHSYSGSKAGELEHEVKALRDQHTQLLTLVSTYEKEAKNASDELQAVKLKETQLERVIQFLRKRSEESHLETNQLAQELAQTQEQTGTLSEELTKNLTLLRETQELLSKEEKAHKQDQEELRALSEQLKLLSDEFDSQSTSMTRLEQEILRLKEELHDQNTLYDTLSKEHTFFKATTMRSVEEAKNELACAQTLHEKILAESEQKHQERERELCDEIECLKESIHHFEAKEAEIEEARLLKASIEQEKMGLFGEIDHLKSQNRQLVADKEEIDQRFKTAQQHLAKKVRETAVATERIDAEKLKSLEMQNQLNLAQIKISELKNSLEMESEHQKRALARESELLKNAENQIARLEEKYFQIHEKWKEAEGQVRELKKVEEKWREAEKLFSKLGHFTPKTKTLSEPPAMKEEPLKPDPAPDPIHQQISLFEEAKNTSSRFKESFL